MSVGRRGGRDACRREPGSIRPERGWYDRRVGGHASRARQPGRRQHAQQAALAGTTATRESVRIPGLKQAAEILVDRWGVPHIFAETQDDAFFVQGYNAARDRLFQIDLWRRRGLGRLSAVFGRAFIEQDKASRLFLYRGDMAAEWAAYDDAGGRGGAHGGGGESKKRAAIHTRPEGETR